MRSNCTLVGGPAEPTCRGRAAPLPREGGSPWLWHGIGYGDMVVALGPSRWQSVQRLSPEHGESQQGVQLASQASGPLLSAAATARFTALYPVTNLCSSMMDWGRRAHASDITPREGLSPAGSDPASRAACSHLPALRPWARQPGLPSQAVPWFPTTSWGTQLSTRGVSRRAVHGPRFPLGASWQLARSGGFAQVTAWSFLDPVRWGRLLPHLEVGISPGLDSWTQRPGVTAGRGARPL